MDFDDEFDIEIQDAIFDIDGENGEMENEIEVIRPGQDQTSNLVDKNPCNGGILDYKCTSERGRKLTQGEGFRIPVNMESSNYTKTDTSHDYGSISAENSDADTNNSKNESAYLPTVDDFEMDDEYDAILTQIDEKIMNSPRPSEDQKSSKSKMIIDVPSNNNVSSIPSYNRHLTPKKSPAKMEYNTETSAFFLSQESVHDLVPVKRKFPGPAGLLPELNNEEILLLDSAPHPLCQKVTRIVKETSFKTRETKEKVTRSNDLVVGRNLRLSKAPWRCLLQTLGLNLQDENSLLNLMNIRLVRTKVRRFPGTVNVPFLVAVIRDEMEKFPAKEKVTSKTPSCKLMDPSGTIVAAVDPNFVEAFASKIMPGTAIALQNCGVSKFGSQIILTVCKKNLLYLVTGKKLDDEDDEVTTAGKEFPLYRKENGLLIMQMAQFNPKKILEEYEIMLTEIKSAYEDQQSEIQDSIVHSNMGPRQQQLFATVSKTSGHFVGPNMGDTNVSNLSESNVSNFNVDCSGFDDDDDDELMQALDNVNFLIEEESL